MSETDEQPHEPRRSFLASISAIVVGGLATIVPLGAGAAALLDPLRDRGEEDDACHEVAVDRFAEPVTEASDHSRGALCHFHCIVMATCRG